MSDPSEDKEKGESWNKIVYDILDTRSKRDDMSIVVAESLLQIKEQEDVGSLANIYEYLAECLSGKKPRELSLEEGAVIISLLDDVRTAVVNQDNSVEKEFLRNGSWWKNSPTDDESGDAETKLSLTAGSSIESGISGPDLLDDYLTACMSFPKIKRITRCLNPLGVPVDLMRKGQEKLFPNQDVQQSDD